MPSPFEPVEPGALNKISKSTSSDFAFLNDSSSQPTKSLHTSRSSVVGKVILGVTGAAVVGLVAVTTPFVLPALRKVCVPYVPATDKQIVNVLRMCRPGTLVDLGSGDGRVVIAAAKQGCQAHGVELNPWLVYYSRLQARLQGLHNKATFSRQDLWKVNLKHYDNIVIFGVSEMDEVQEGIDSVWLYRKKTRNKSTLGIRFLSNAMPGCIYCMQAISRSYSLLFYGITPFFYPFVLVY
ncbi:ATP synthase subunit C lysine N-methyltransferase isoform X2 [Nematostella vectensis]|uniref:ATP synthase subunit C lysine N-methyltransferase isoform X2 n=2 Tax=Nematostella vectensis TaxID=45351 RepID=UPI002077052F|nr:ATP synthase subunit C lysine N-methyltransferase isoform X2 [Nematostella vectensis]